MTSVAIIGAGPGGCFAAIAAARRGLSVTVYERNAKPLKKLLASGNGRGNLLNQGAPRYYGDAAFAGAVLARVPAARVAALWNELGVPLRAEDEGRVYPAALLAAVAADALRLELERLGVATRLNARVEAIEALPGGGYTVRSREAEPPPADARRAPAPAVVYAERYDSIIVAAGGQASPALGADGDGCALLRALGHAITPTRPALCALTTGRKAVAGLSGQRLRARLTLQAADGRALHETDGEALFADDGVSGIAAMQLARFVEPGCALHLDLRPALCMAGDAPAALAERLRALRVRRAGFAAARLLDGWFAPRVASRLLARAGIAVDAPIAGLTDARLGALAALLCEWELPVAGTRGWDAAQVTAGGARTDEFDPATLQSRLRPGLYAVGEALDVDGDCGGYNLLFASASGWFAGESAAR